MAQATATASKTAVSSSGQNPKPQVIQKKKSGDIGTPSISKALLGNVVEDEKPKSVVSEEYSNKTFQTDSHFTLELLHEVWSEFSKKYASQVHLSNTLLTKPDLLDGYNVRILVENSVQQDQIRLLKPEIIGFLQRKLNNSKIDVVIEMVEKSDEDKLFTDEQKMVAMMKKNPVLQKMKNLFNLDFTS